MFIDINTFIDKYFVIPHTKMLIWPHTTDVVIVIFNFYVFWQPEDDQ